MIISKTDLAQYVLLCGVFGNEIVEKGIKNEIIIRLAIYHWADKTCFMRHINKLVS